MEKMEYLPFTIGVQGIAQMLIDSIDGLGIQLEATVCETWKEDTQYLGVQIRNVTETDMIEMVERYYLDAMYEDYKKDKISIAEIAEMMVVEYITKLSDALTEDE